MIRRKSYWFVTNILLFVVTLGFIYQVEIIGFVQRMQTILGEKFAEEEMIPEEEEEVLEEPLLLYDPEKPMIALTFDDGPSIYTEKLLDKLEECDARATFFVLGNNVKKYPDVIKRMEEIGCEIGNHTYRHPDLTTLKGEKIKSQIEKTNKEIEKILGHGTELVRPTYGAINDKVIKNTPYPLILWSVDTTDWKKKKIESVERYVLNHAEDGDIILLHDIHSNTVNAMMELIPKLQEKGFQLVTVSEMAEARGVQLEERQKYFEFKK